ncbi:MAG: formylglycine-generating enzyme family protein [Acidimicrobiia bacterium]
MAASSPIPPHLVAPEPEADLARSGPLLAAFGPAVAVLVAMDASSLIGVLSDPSSAFAQRLAAATIVSLIGDPRFDALAPDMVDVPAAIVSIGLDSDRIDAVAARWAHVGVERSWIAKEAPAHRLHVEAFRIGRYPVTNAEYLQFVLAVPEAPRPTAWAHGTFPWASANHPVYSLPTHAPGQYTTWLSTQTGRQFRLPTEAEWEYASTGGDDREFPWGNEWDPARANTAEAGPLTTTPVGIYHEGCSPFGLHDLAGNVEEYVSDAYAPYPGGEHIDDDLTALYPDGYRIARGGSYARHGDLARCRRRHGWYPSDHYAMGFRLAETM